MIDKKTRNVIEDHAYNCTIGFGDPNCDIKKELIHLMSRLKRDELIDEEVILFKKLVRQNIQCIGQP